MKAICVSLSHQFPAGISILLLLFFFYFTMSASSWPRCTRCQGEVQTSCILWCEIKYHCGNIVSWSLFFPSTLMFQWRCICKKQVWGVIWYVLRDCAFVFNTTGGVHFLNCFCFWSLHKVHLWTKWSKSPVFDLLVWDQDEALSSAWTPKTAKYAPICFQNYLKIIRHNWQDC